MKEGKKLNNNLLKNLNLKAKPKKAVRGISLVQAKRFSFYEEVAYQNNPKKYTTIQRFCFPEPYGFLYDDAKTPIYAYLDKNQTLRLLLGCTYEFIHEERRFRNWYCPNGDFEVGIDLNPNFLKNWMNQPLPVNFEEYGCHFQEP